MSGFFGFRVTGNIFKFASVSDAVCINETFAVGDTLRISGFREGCRVQVMETAPIIDIRIREGHIEVTTKDKYGEEEYCLYAI